MICVVGNEKGGVGKTTLAVNLAAMAALAGRDVLLADADPQQQSAARWAARRVELHPDAPPVRSVGIAGPTLRVELADLARRYGTVVVDTGAEDSPELRAAALVADVLVIPVQPDSFDVWTLPTMESLWERAKAMNPKLRLVLVVNRVPHQTAAATLAEVGDWIAENVPGLAGATLVPLVGRAAYGRASAEGMGVVEMPRRDTKASAEVEALYNAVLG